MTGITSAVTAGLSFFVGFVGASLADNGGHATPALLALAMRSNIHPNSAWAIGDALGAYVLVEGVLMGLGVGTLVRNGASKA